MDKSKLIMIIGAVLIVISIALSTVSVVMMRSALSSKNENEVEAEKDDIKLALSETTSFELTDAVVATLSSSEDSKTTMSVSIEIGFLLDKGNKATGSIISLMTEKEGVIRDRITKLLKSKDAEYMEAKDADTILQQEILELISTELDTDTIVEVFFKNSLQSKR